MYRPSFNTLDAVLMVFGPPLLGCAVGLLLSLNRRRPGLAAMGGLVGGTAGAWVGLVFYRSQIMYRDGDFGFFDACVLAGFLLGAIPVGWCLAGSKVAPPTPCQNCGLRWSL